MSQENMEKEIEGCGAGASAEQGTASGQQMENGQEPETIAGMAGASETESMQQGESPAKETEETKSKDSASEAPEKEKPERGGFFGKKKKDPRDEQIEELQDRLKRQMAEFDNFRKRTEKEKSAMYEIGARDIIEKILPVVDNFERALAAVPEEEKGNSFTEGVEKIYKQFVKTLEDAGVEPIEAVGQQFDPNLHNAVMHVEDETLGENEISQELQKGYKYRGTVVRHSMVQVAN